MGILETCDYHYPYHYNYNYHYCEMGGGGAKEEGFFRGRLGEALWLSEPR